jgi:Domain of unknown function (DUF4293)
MWQRKQTIFLALTGSLMVLMIFFPAWVAEQDGIRRELYPLHYSVTESGAKAVTYFPYAISAIFAAAAATLAFLAIGKFENRMTQIKMGALNSLLMAGSLGALVYFATQLIERNQMAGQYGLSLWLPAGAMISNMIANRFIRRDEKLVRDSERIR